MKCLLYHSKLLCCLKYYPLQHCFIGAAATRPVVQAHDAPFVPSVTVWDPLPHVMWESEVERLKLTRLLRKAQEKAS